MTPNINNFNPNMSLQEYKAPTPLDLPVPQYVPLSTPTIYDPPKFDIPSLNTNVGGSGKKGDGWDIDGFMRDLKTDRLTSNVAFNTSGFASQTGFGAIGSDYGKMTLEGKSQRFEDLYDFNSDGKGVKKFKNFYDPSTDEDRLARQQGAFEKTLNGIMKMQNTIATTVARGTVGAVYGLGSSLANWDLSKMYDNSLQQSLGDWDMEVRSALANYRTNEEKQRSFLGKMATVNFWADDFLQGVGYIAGIALTHYITGGIGSRVTALARGTTVGANPSVLAGLSGELGAVANQATASLLKDSAKGLLKTFIISAGSEGATTAYQFRNDAIDSYIAKSIAKKGYVDQKEFSDYVDSSSRAANGVFLVSSAVSAASDFVQFGKILGVSPGLSKIGSKLGLDKIANKLWIGTGMNKATSEALRVALGKGGAEALEKFLSLEGREAFSRTWKGKALEHIASKGGKMTMEAIEEGGVGVAESMGWAALNSMYDVDNLHKTSEYIEGGFSGFFDMDNFVDAVDKQVSTPEGRHEMYMGALLGLVGGSFMRAATGDFKGAVQELTSNEFAQERARRANAFTQMQDLLRNDIEAGMTSDNFGAVADSFIERMKRITAAGVQTDKANEMREQGAMFMADLLDSSASFDQMMMLSERVFGGNTVLDNSVQQLFNARVDALDNNALRLEHGFESEDDVKAMKEAYKENFVKRQQRFDTAMKYAQDYAQLLRQDENSTLIDVLARQRYMYDTALEAKDEYGKRIAESLNIAQGQEFQNVLDGVIKGYDDITDRITDLQKQRADVEKRIKKLQQRRLNEASKKGDIKNTKKGVNENQQIRDYQQDMEDLQNELAEVEAQEQQLAEEYNRAKMTQNALANNSNSSVQQNPDGRTLRSNLTFTEIAKLYDDVNNLGNIAIALRNSENFEQSGKDFLNTLESYTNAVNAIDSMERFFDDIDKATRTEGVVPSIVQKVADFFGRETKDRSDRQDRGAQAYIDNDGKEVKSEEDQFVEGLVEDVINTLPTEKAKEKARKNSEMMEITKALVRLQYRTRFNRQGEVVQQNYNFLNAIYERDPFETVSDEEWTAFANEESFTKEEVIDEATGLGTGDYVYNTNDKIKGVVDNIVERVVNGEKLSLRERKIYDALNAQDVDFFNTLVNQAIKDNNNSTTTIGGNNTQQNSQNNQNTSNDPNATLFEEVSRRVAERMALISRQTGVSEDDITDIINESREIDQVTQGGNGKPRTNLQRDIEAYKDLSTRNDLTEDEEQQLQDLKDRLAVMDSAINIAEKSSLLDDLDLLNQLSQYADNKSEVSKDYTPDTVSDSNGKPFSDEEVGGGRSANHAQNYSNAFMTVETDDDGNQFINLSNLSLKGFLSRFTATRLTRTNKKGVTTDLKDASEIKADENAVYTITTAKGTYSFKYNKHGNILLDANDTTTLLNLREETKLDTTVLLSNKFSNYSPLYEIDDAGNYHPVPSDIEVETKDGKNYKIDQNAVKELKPGDEIFIVYPTDAVYNKRRVKGETSVKEDVLLLGDSKGRIVGVLKAGHGVGGKYESLMRLRNEAVTRVRDKKTNKVFNANPNLIHTGLSVTVNTVENGHPNIQLSRDANGNLINQHFTIPNQLASNVKVLGFGMYDSRKAEDDPSKYLPSVTNKGVKDLSLSIQNFRFVNGAAKSSSNGVVSYVLLEYNGKTVAYPASMVPSNATTLADTVTSITSNNKISLAERAKMVNELLMEQGVDVVSDPQYKHLFATKDNVAKQDYNDAITRDVSVPAQFMGSKLMSMMDFSQISDVTTLNINLQDENIFFAPKFSMDLDNIMDGGIVWNNNTNTNPNNPPGGNNSSNNNTNNNSSKKNNKSSGNNNSNNNSSNGTTENTTNNGNKTEGKKEEKSSTEDKKEGPKDSSNDSSTDMTIESFLSLQTNAQQKKWVRELARKLGFARMMAETRVDGKVSIDDIVNYLQHKLGEDTPQNYKMAEHYKDTYLNNVMSKGKTIAYLIDNMIGEQISEAKSKDAKKKTETKKEGPKPVEEIILTEEVKPAEENNPVEDGKSKKEKKVPPKIENKPVDNKKPADSSSISSLLSLQSNLAQKKWIEDLAKRLGFTNQLADTRVEGKVFDGDIINYITHKLAEDTPQNRKLIEFYRTKYLEGIAVKDKNKNLADVIDAMIENEASMDSEQQVETINEEASELFPESLFPETGSSEKTSTKKRDTKKDTKKSKKTTVSDKNSKNNCK